MYDHSLSGPDASGGLVDRALGIAIFSSRPLVEVDLRFSSQDLVSSGLRITSTLGLVRPIRLIEYLS